MCAALKAGILGDTHAHPRLCRAAYPGASERDEQETLKYAKAEHFRSTPTGITNSCRFLAICLLDRVVVAFLLLRMSATFQRLGIIAKGPLAGVSRHKQPSRTLTIFLAEVHVFMDHCLQRPWHTQSLAHLQPDPAAVLQLQVPWPGLP